MCALVPCRAAALEKGERRSRCWGRWLWGAGKAGLEAVLKAPWVLGGGIPSRPFPRPGPSCSRDAFPAGYQGSNKVPFTLIPCCCESLKTDLLPGHRCAKLSAA